MSLYRLRRIIFLLLTLFFITILPFPAPAPCSVSFTNLIFGKQAVSFTDEVLSEILEEWSLAKLTYYAHPQFYQKVSYDNVKQLFFQFKKLGTMTKYYGAKGEVVTGSTSESEKVPVGKYTALVDFENGTATISLVIQKSSSGWNIISFVVESESFNAPLLPQQSAVEIAGESASLTKNELEKAVQHILDTDSVQQLRNVDKLFQLADLYLNEGDEGKALMLFDQVFRGDAAHLEKQLTFARLLLKNQQDKRAVNVLSNINRFTENGILFHESSELLKSLGKDLSVLFEPEADFRNDIEIMLIPVGSPQLQILEELRIALQNEIGIAVHINDKTVEHGKFDIKLSDRWITEVFTIIEKDLTPLQHKMLLSEININKEKLQTVQQQYRFIRAYLKKTGANNSKSELEYFEQQLKKIQEQGQYDVYRLSRKLRDAFPYDKSTTIKSYIGVSSQNLGSKDSNFLFGGSDGSYGIITYYNFTAANNNELENRERLVKRLLKQALSTVNFTFDIQRCSTPFCARAYPHSVKEHDAKSDHLCAICRQRLSEFKKLLTSENDAYEYEKLGWKYIQNAEWEKAISVLNKAVNCGEEYDGYAYEKLGVAYYNNKQYDQGVASCRKAIEIFDKDVDLSSGYAYEILGNNYNAMGRHADTVAAYLKAIEAVSVTAATQIFLGDHFLSKKEYKTAIKHFSAAKELNKEDSRPYYGLGIAYSNIKQISRAIENLETAETSYSTNPDFYRLLGYCYDVQHNRNKAIEYYKKSVELQPTIAQSHMDLGRLYGQTGQLDASIASSRKALVLQPQNKDIWNSLGYTYYLKKNFRKAIRHYTKAIELDPLNALVHYNKALAHYSLSEFDKAIVHYDISVSLNYTGAWQFNAALQKYRHKKSD